MEIKNFILKKRQQTKKLFKQKKRNKKQKKHCQGHELGKKYPQETPWSVQEGNLTIDVSIEELYLPYPGYCDRYGVGSNPLDKE